MAAIGRHIDPQRGDLDSLAPDHRCHRAVGETGRHHLDSAVFQQACHVIGGIRRGDIDISDVAVRQQVSYASADKAHVPAPAAQRLHHAGDTGRRQERRRIDGGYGMVSAGAGARIACDVIA